MQIINNPSRVQDGFARSQRARSTTWGAMAAGGGRILRTVDGTTDALATVGDTAPAVAALLERIDSSPATFLAPLATVAAGTELDLPRLVRGVLADRPDAAPDCDTVQALSALRDQLADAKPGAAAAVFAVVTTALDPFGPILVPAKVAHFDRHGDHHTRIVRVDLSMALAAADPGDVDDLIEDLEDLGSATLDSSLIGTLCDWDRTFAEEMDEADWETVEVLTDPVTLTVLTGLRERDCPLDTPPA